MKKNEHLIPILYEYLDNIDINDSFFDSLKKDYYHFEEWYERKSMKKEKAYITYNSFNELGSFLLLKIENKNEDYSNFKKSFSKGKRLKICTFKVKNNGYGIGGKYFKIILEEAKKNKVNEIYITLYKKQTNLMELLMKYNFILYTTKLTKKLDLSIEEELVFVKKV